MQTRSWLSSLCLVLAAACGLETGSTSEPSTADPDVTELRRAINPMCIYPKRPDDPVLEREMVITDKSVVNDPCRTSWTNKWGPSNTACPSGTLGVWTFKYLIENIAGGDTALANRITTEWLMSFVRRDLQVNGQLLNRFRSPLDEMMRPKDNRFTQKIIQPWRERSGCSRTDLTAPCPYDLTKAPLRLLAIVNRVDMAGLSGYIFSPNSQTSSGEGRFVFGFVDVEDPFYGSDTEYPLAGTAIFEYRLPAFTPLDTRAWAMRWHALSSITPQPGPVYDPGASFNTTLADITSRFVRTGVDPSGPNGGSAFSQLRTNERDFDSAAGSDVIWELREHTLQIAQGVPCPPSTRGCLVLPSVTKQTPSNEYQENINGTETLTNFFLQNDNWVRIAAETYEVPTDYLAAVSRFSNAASGPDRRILNLWTLSDNKNRFDQRVAIANFGFGTCNGCHYVETNNSDGFHINPRKANEASRLSGFLKGLISFKDPRPYNVRGMEVQEVLDFNEPERRRCEIRRILAGDGRPVQTTPTGATRSH